MLLINKKKTLGDDVMRLISKMKCTAYNKIIYILSDK